MRIYKLYTTLEKLYLFSCVGVGLEDSFFVMLPLTNFQKCAVHLLIELQKSEWRFFQEFGLVTDKHFQILLKDIQNASTIYYYLLLGSRIKGLISGVYGLAGWLVNGGWK